MSTRLCGVAGRSVPVGSFCLLAALLWAAAGCGKTGLPLDVGRGSEEGPLEVEPPRAGVAGAPGPVLIDPGSRTAAGAGGRASRDGSAGSGGRRASTRADRDAGMPDWGIRDAGVPDSGSADAGLETDAGAPQDCEGGVFDGTVTVESPKDLERLRGCTRITGNLGIYTAQLDSLAGLEQLRVVDGSMVITLDRDFPHDRNLSRMPAQPRLQSLAGLSGLERVGGLVWLLGLSVTQVDGLAKLQNATLSIETMPALESLAALSGLTFRLLRVADCPGLRTLDGPRPAAQVEVLELSKLPTLESIAALRGMREVGALSLHELPALKSLDGLQDLQTLSGQLIILNCDTLTDLRGLDGLTGGMADVTLMDNDGLTSTAGFVARGGSFGLSITNSPNLTTVTNLATDGGQLRSLSLDLLPRLTRLPALAQTSIEFVSIVACDALPNLTGFGALTTIGEITLTDAASLSSLKGLEGVTEIQVAQLGSLASLAHLQGLEKLARVGILRIVDNPALIDLVGLDGLTSAEGVELRGNVALKNLRGLGRLQNALELSIYENPALQSLEGLAGLTELGLLHVGYNPMLKTLMGPSMLKRATRIELMVNQTLAALTGLEALTSVDGALIDSNPALIDLRGLSGLMSASWLEVRGNRRLPQCEVDWLAMRTGAMASGADNGPAGSCAP